MVVLGTIANNMPELPEVETVKNVLSEYTLHKQIKSVDVLRKHTVETDTEEFVNKLKGQTINSFSRVGKFIVFHLSNNLVLISHLRMEGKYFLKNEDEELTKHDLVVFHFTDNTKLIYNDTRRFGRMSLETEDTYMNVAPLNNVGPDPFMMKDASILEKAFKHKSIAIKTTLLDQSIMSGLGNIYVDEVLYATKIHPETPANLVSKKQLKDIFEASKNVLQRAIDAGGSTIKSYHPKEGISGNFQVSLQVYGRKDQTCSRCGSKLRKIFVNGRGTTYCPKCQKNPAIPALIGVTGPVGSGKSTVSKSIEKLGYIRLDCDEIVHNLYQNKEVQNGLKKIISGLAITNKKIDRVWLKNYLIENPNKKRRLEKYIHALVIEEVERELKNSKLPIVVEAPLLFESGLDLICDKIVYVDVDYKTQVEHLKARGSDVEKSLLINSTFDKKNRKKATYVINNNNDIAYLNKQIESIFCK